MNYSEKMEEVNDFVRDYASHLIELHEAIMLIKRCGSCDEWVAGKLSEILYNEAKSSIPVTEIMAIINEK